MPCVFYVTFVALPDYHFTAEEIDILNSCYINMKDQWVDADFLLTPEGGKGEYYWIFPRDTLRQEALCYLLTDEKRYRLLTKIDEDGATFEVPITIYPPASVHDDYVLSHSIEECDIE